MLIFTSYLPAYNDHCALSRTCRSYRSTLSQSLAFQFMCETQRWPRLGRQQFVDKLRAVTFYAQATHTATSFSLTTPATTSSSLLPQSLSSGISHLFLPSSSSSSSGDSQSDSRVWLVTSAPVCAFKVYDRVQEKVVDSVSPSLSFSAVDVCGSNVLLAHAHTSMLYLYSLTTHELTPINKKRITPSAAMSPSTGTIDESDSIISSSSSSSQQQSVVVKHTSSVTCVRMIALSDGRLLGASGSYDATVRCWDLQTGEQIAQLKSDNEMTVWCVDIHPSGTLLCCGSNDKTVRVYQLHTTATATATGPYTSSKGDENGELLCRLEGHTRTPMVTKFDPYEADRCLFSGGYDAVIRQWDYRAGVQLRKFKGHANIIFSLAITPHVVVSSSRDGTLRIYDRCSRVLLRVLTPRPHCPAGAVSSSSATPLNSSIGDIKTVVLSERGDAILCGTSSGLLYEWRLRERGSGGVYGSGGSDSEGMRGVRSIEASLSAITEPKLMNVFKSLRVKLAGIGHGTAR